MSVNLKLTNIFVLMWEMSCFKDIRVKIIFRMRHLFRPKTHVSVKIVVIEMKLYENFMKNPH